MKKILLLVFLIGIAYSVKAQEGAPLLTNFKESNEIENQNWAVCQDDNNVMLFANRRGILTFDGQGWSFIQIPTIPYSLKYNPSEKRVYVGGDNNYGYIARDEMGIYKYFSVSGDTCSLGLISRIIFTDSTVYFYGEQSISRHNLKTGKLELRLREKDNEPFSGMFITPGNTFINVLASGLYRLESDTLFPIVTGYLLKDEEILFSLPYSNKLVLLGKSDGNLSLFDGIKFYDYPIKDEGYLRENILSEGLIISDSLYAFSTLDGGALVVEKKSGRIKHTINYVNGLPDDEIFALGVDNNHGLWLSHQYGLTRADLSLPVENFSIYPGLKGNLITCLWHNGELYVATSEGMYYLNEVKNYSQVEVLVQREGSLKSQAVEPGKRKMPVPLQMHEPPKTRKSIFAQIFGKKQTSPVAQVPQEQNRPSLVMPELKLPEPKYFKKVTGRLKSINYVFKKIEGLNEKCKQMVSAGNVILASTNRGLYIIAGHKASAMTVPGYINYISSKSKDNKYYVATSEGYFYVTPDKDNKWIPVYPDRSFNHSIYSIVSTDENSIWAGGDDIAYRINLRGIPGEQPVTYTLKLNSPQRYIIESVNDTVFLFTSSKLSYYDQNLDNFVPYRKDITGNNARIKFVFSQPDVPWIRTVDEWINLSSSADIHANDKAVLKIFDNISSIYTTTDNIWIVNSDNMIFRILRNKMTTIKPDVGLFLRSISDAKGSNFKLSDVVFDSGDNTVYFDVVAPGYLKQSSTQYRYIVDNIMKNWSKWSYNNTIPLMIKPGKYTLQVKAKDIWGNISDPKIVRFTIEAPFTQTTVFYIIILCAICIVIVGIIRYRERKLKKDKRILESRVKERTARIEAQKQEITSSIEYASRIQMAMLPEQEHFSNSFPEYFIIFNPRDIVSGDFYWIAEDEKRIYFTVADCTGHGVPGAFMSTLGISTLDEIITNNANLKANTVLNLMREKIKTSLHQTGKEGEANDGMDMAFCILHKNRKTIEFSGAFNPLYLFHDGEICEYHADRMPIGIYYGEKESFTNYKIEVHPGDILYIFTDGFADQFGGSKATKYMKYNLKKLLTEIHDKPMAEQRGILEYEFEMWKGSANQVDDVTILGVRI